MALLERVLDNLIDNALRHTPAGGSVTVRAEPRGEHVRVAVTDTGPGLTPTEVERIFDRFYGGDQARSSASGPGPGLAIVRSILELHGTDAAVASQPGHGTSFSFQLPTAGDPPRFRTVGHAAARARDISEKSRDEYTGPELSPSCR